MNLPAPLSQDEINARYAATLSYLAEILLEGAEVRIFAAYSGDKKLIQAINEGMDAHSFFTSEVFGYTYAEVEDARRIADDLYDKKIRGESFDKALFDAVQLIVKKRTNCKRVVFGTLYGAAAPKIAETAGISLKRS